MLIKLSNTRIVNSDFIKYVDKLNGWGVFITFMDGSHESFMGFYSAELWNILEQNCARVGINHENT